MGRNSHARGKKSGLNDPDARPVCKVSRYMSDSVTLGLPLKRFGGKGTLENKG